MYHYFFLPRRWAVRLKELELLDLVAVRRVQRLADAALADAWEALLEVVVDSGLVAVPADRRAADSCGSSVGRAACDGRRDSWGSLAGTACARSRTDVAGPALDSRRERRAACREAFPCSG